MKTSAAQKFELFVQKFAATSQNFKPVVADFHAHMYPSMTLANLIDSSEKKNYRKTPNYLIKIQYKARKQEENLSERKS